jgi:hypothetical protein
MLKRAMEKEHIAGAIAIALMWAPVGASIEAANATAAESDLSLGVPSRPATLCMP